MKKRAYIYIPISVFICAFSLISLFSYKKVKADSVKIGVINNDIDLYKFDNDVINVSTFDNYGENDINTYIYYSIFYIVYSIDTQLITSTQGYNNILLTLGQWAWNSGLNLNKAEIGVRYYPSKITSSVLQYGVMNGEFMEINDNLSNTYMYYLNFNTPIKYTTINERYLNIVFRYSFNATLNSSSIYIVDDQFWNPGFYTYYNPLVIENIQESYNNGYNIGLENGLEEGQNYILNNPNQFNLYTAEQAQAEFTRGVNTANENALKYKNVLANAFDGAKSFLETEIFPGISIALILGLPLLLGLFLLIMKLIRG